MATPALAQKRSTGPKASCAREMVSATCASSRDVAAQAQRAGADVGRDGARAVFVEVDDHDAARSLLRQPPRQGAPDARRAARDDRDPVCELHARHHRVRPGRGALPLPLSARA